MGEGCILCCVFCTLECICITFSMKKNKTKHKDLQGQLGESGLRLQNPGGQS